MRLKIRYGFIERYGKCNCSRGDNCPRPHGSSCKRRMKRMK